MAELCPSTCYSCCETLGVARSGRYGLRDEAVGSRMPIEGGGGGGGARSMSIMVSPGQILLMQPQGLLAGGNGLVV